MLGLKLNHVSKRGPWSFCKGNPPVSDGFLFQKASNAVCWRFLWLHFDEIACPFPNVNGCTVEVWEWKSNFTQHFIMDVITHPYWDSSQTLWVNGALGVLFEVKARRLFYRRHSSTVFSILFKLQSFQLSGKGQGNFISNSGICDGI